MYSSVVLNISHCCVTNLLDFFTLAQLKLCTHWKTAPYLLLPLPLGNHHSTLYLYKLECSARIGGIILCLSFCDWLISLSIMSSRLSHVVIVCVRISFLLRLNNTPSFVYTTFCLPIHPLMGTWVASTSWLYNAAMNIRVHFPCLVSVGIFFLTCLQVILIDPFRGVITQF